MSARNLAHMWFTMNNGSLFPAPCPICRHTQVCQLWRVTRARSHLGYSKWMATVPNNLTAISAYLADFGFKPPVSGKVTRRWLNELYSRSPVPVYEQSSERSFGYYQPCVPDIWLSPRRPLYQRASTFLHELGHHRCYEAKCDCWPEGILGPCEAHAIAFSLQACLILRIPRSQRFVMWCVTKMIRKCRSPRSLGDDVCSLINLAWLTIRLPRQATA